MKYQYRIVLICPPISVEATELKLNELGSDGWNLVSVSEANHLNGGRRYIFKHSVTP